MGEVYEWKVMEKEIKKRERQLKREQRREAIKTFVINNKELCITLVVTFAPLAICAGKMVINGIASAVKKGEMAKMEKAKSMRIYDASLRRWWDLSRPLSNSDLEYISIHRNAGESLAHILSQLKVI